jgi:hypothetical protein
MKKDEAPPGKLRWNIEQRLEFIESRLIWEGRINRADIATRFRVKVQQASADLRRYEELAPDNLTYDRLSRTFVPAATFKPRFVREYADRPLLQLAAIGAKLVNPAETWFDKLPPLGVVPVPQRHVPTAIMRWILEAIRKGSAIEIHYQSIKRAEAVRRTIVPHALGSDGDRWHARAWCPTDRIFKDFVLSRIAEVGALTPSRIDPEADREWHDEIAFVLAPNPALSEGSRRSISKVYDMVRGRLHFEVRVALAYYAMRRLNLDLTGLKPERQQLVLTNAAEIDAACAQSRAASLALIAAGRHEKPEPNNPPRGT